MSALTREQVIETIADALEAEYPGYHGQAAQRIARALEDEGAHAGGWELQ